MLNPNLIGLYTGMTFGSLFLLFVLCKYKKVPEFSEIVVIILSCTGVVMGIHLGFIALTIPDTELGQLKEHRVPVVLGALAVTWTSVGSIFKTCKQSIDAIKS